MIIQGLESFPISCCNSWGIPNLSNRMSLGDSLNLAHSPTYWTQSSMYKGPFFMALESPGP